MLTDAGSDDPRSLDGCCYEKRGPSPGDCAAETGLNFGVRGWRMGEVNGPDANPAEVVKPII